MEIKSTVFKYFVIKESDSIKFMLWLNYEKNVIYCIYKLGTMER